MGTLLSWYPLALQGRSSGSSSGSAMTARGRGLFAHAAAAALGLAALTMLAQRCFLSASLPDVRHAEHADVALTSLMETDFAAGSLLAGSGVPSLQGDRDVRVAMYNKKRTKRDRSEGWTLRKKFRSCSLLARASTVKGRKILKKRMWRGKKVLAPGDYCNYKMVRVKSLR